VSPGDPKAFTDKPPPTRRGRPKGSRNKMGRDLMDLVMQASEELGFLKKDETGQLVAGEGGTLGYLKWIGIHKPERFVALMSRIAPKHVIAQVTHSIMTREETDAELKDLGLPPDLIEHLRLAPQELDYDEDPDPYRMVDVTPENDTGKK
jgi:hypothetical protein